MAAFKGTAFAGVAVIALLLLAHMFPRVTAFTNSTVYLIDVLREPGAPALPSEGNMLLTIRRAAELVIPGCDKGDESAESGTQLAHVVPSFHLADFRPDLLDRSGARWIVLDLRPQRQGECTALPPASKHPWAAPGALRSANQTLALYASVVEQELCPDFPAPVTAVVTAPPPRLVADAVMVWARRMHWNSISILSSHDCAPPPRSLAFPFFNASAKEHQIELRYGVPGCGCECLDFDSHQVFLFVSNSLAESADAIYRAYSQNWLSPPHVILFNNELFFINLVNLRDYMSLVHGPLGLKAYHAFAAIAVNIGAWRGRWEEARISSELFDNFGNDSAIAGFDHSDRDGVVFWRGVLRARVDATRPFCQRALPQWDLPLGYQAADQPVSVTRPILSGVEIERAYKPNISSAWQFRDAQGRPAEEPILLLSKADPAFLPQALFPARLQIAVLVDPYLISDLAALANELEHVASKSSEVTLSFSYHNATGTICDAASLPSSAALALLFVQSRCVQDLQASWTPSNPVLLWHALDRTPQLPRKAGLPAAFYSVDTPLQSRITMLQLLIIALALEDGILISDRPDACAAAGWEGYTLCIDGELTRDHISRIHDFRSPVLAFDLSASNAQRFAVLGRSLFELPYFHVLSIGMLSEHLTLPEAVLPRKIIDEVSTRTVILSNGPLTAPVGGIAATMAAIAVSALQREVNTYGMGFDSVRTHLSAARGLGTISFSRPVLHDGVPFAFDASGYVEGTVRVLIPSKPGGESFAQILPDGNLAIFDFALRERLQRPTLQDYLKLRSNTPASTAGAHSSNIAIILGVSLPVAAVLCVVALLAVHLHRNKVVYRPHDFGPAMRALPLSNRRFAAPLEVPLRALRIGQELGKGSFGCVYKGRMDNRAVAIKVKRPDPGGNTKDGADDAHRRMLQEMLVLAQFRGERNVVQLAGVVTRGPTLYMAMELCAHGSLARYLYEQQRQDLTVSWARKYEIALDISRGMAAVHAAGYLHMDLAARNVLVTASGRCKLCDFGLAAQELYYEASASRPMAVRWMAPEVLRGERCSRASDVWSFGVLLFELGTNASAVPYAGLSAAAVVAAVAEGRRPDLVYDMPEPMTAIVWKCTEHDRELRPSFELLKREIRAYVRGQPERDDSDGARHCVAMFEPAVRLPEPKSSVSEISSSVASPTGLGASESEDSALPHTAPTLTSHAHHTEQAGLPVQVVPTLECTAFPQAPFVDKQAGSSSDQGVDAVEHEEMAPTGVSPFRLDHSCCNGRLSGMSIV